MKNQDSRRGQDLIKDFQLGNGRSGLQARSLTPPSYGSDFWSRFGAGQFLPFQSPAHSPSVFKAWVLPASHPGHHLSAVTLTSPGYGLFML